MQWIIEWCIWSEMPWIICHIRPPVRYVAILAPKLNGRKRSATISMNFRSDQHHLFWMWGFASPYYPMENFTFGNGGLSAMIMPLTQTVVGNGRGPITPDWLQYSLECYTYIWASIVWGLCGIASYCSGYFSLIRHDLIPGIFQQG